MAEDDVEEEVVIEERRASGERRKKHTFTPDGVQFTWTAFTALITIFGVLWKISPVIAAWGTVPSDVRAQSAQMGEVVKSLDRLSNQMAAVQETNVRLGAEVRTNTNDIVGIQNRITGLEVVRSANVTRLDRVEAQLNELRRAR